MIAGIATLADVERIEAKPLALRGLPADVLGVIEAGRARSEGRDALVFMPDASAPENVLRYSYDALIGAVERAAAGLGAIGGVDAVVSIVLPNLPDTHAALWGAQTIGRANPINPLLDAPAIADIMRAAGATVAVTLAPLPGQDLFAKVAEAVQSVPTLKAIAVVDPFRHLGRTDALLAAARVLAHPIDVFDFADLPGVEGGFDRRRRGDDVAALFHTGGTTGVPKIAQLTHANQVFTAWSANVNRTMERHRTIFCGLPLFHVNGALVTGLVAWFTGATVLLGPPEGFRAPGLIENFWGIVEHHRVGAVSAVPTVYAMLAEQATAGRDISSLEFCICGAAPMRAELIERFERATGVPILEGYGLTEGTCVSAINPGYGERRPGSVGLRTPYQGVVVLTEVDGDWTRASAGAAGLIAIKGPNVFTGYLREADDEKAWIELDGARWYDTGDLGRIDDDGYLWLTGRRKELIIRGGHNIDPAVIEEALVRHPAVRSAAAVGAPDARLGEVPVAYVELKLGQAAEASELLHFAADHIAERAAVPKAINVVSALPLTVIGKINKPELRRREVERLAQHAADEALGGGRLALGIALDPEYGFSGMALGATLSLEQEDLLRSIVLPLGVRELRFGSDAK